MLRASPTLANEVAPPGPHKPRAEYSAKLSAVRSVEPLSEPTEGIFLTAQWRNLAMLSWEIDPDVLAPLVPPGLELDSHGGKTYISMVGFQFLDVRLLGLPIPFHRNFEEVNLRFYVVRRVGRHVRRGVVFVKEICPRWAVSSVARWVYNEQYVTLPMRHRVTIDSQHGVASPTGEDGESIYVEYAWRSERTWHGLNVHGSGAPSPPPADSLAEFIVEHYWAYTRQRDGGCVEYRVAHRPWRIWPVQSAKLSARLSEAAEPYYGRELAQVLRHKPVSALLADGSPVKVYRGKRM